MSTITIKLDDEVDGMLRDLVAKSGQDVSAVIADAIARSFEWNNDQPPLTPEQEAAIREGLASLDRGEGIPHEQVMAELKAKYG